MMRIGLSSLILISLSFPLWAQGNFTKTPITQNQNAKSEGVAALAQLWGLDTKDYIRYTEIIKGPLGRWNANIDPILALGIYSENKNEKRKYAELYAKQEYELTKRTQAFQREYRATFNRLYPNSEIILNEYLQSYYDNQANKDKARSLVSNTTNFESGDRILYFPKTDCELCDYQIKRLYTILNQNPTVVLDIYVLGAKQEVDVRKWAKNKAINIEWINQAKITLNMNKGLLAKLNKSKVKDAYLYLSRGDSIFKIEPNQIGL